MNQPKGKQGHSEGDVVEVEVERIVPGGLGLCHLPDQTMFVALAAPGDRVRVRIQRVQGRSAFGAIVDLIEASPKRTQPFCPYFGRCGSCDFQHLSYEAQLTAKVGIVEDCLRRIAGISEPPTIRNHPLAGSGRPSVASRMAGLRQRTARWLFRSKLAHRCRHRSMSGPRSRT